jgi:hypothetical protein
MAGTSLRLWLVYAVYLEPQLRWGLKLIHVDTISSATELALSRQRQLLSGN